MEVLSFLSLYNQETFSNTGGALLESSTFDCKITSEH